MDDLLIVDVFQSIANSIEKTLDLRCEKSSPNASQLIQRLVFAELQEYIHMLPVLEAVIKLNHVGVMESFMEFYLIGKAKSSSM